MKTEPSFPTVAPGRTVRGIEAVGLTKIFRTPGPGPLPFRRKEVLAVSDVHLAISPGEIFGILGENGAGKTTLLKLLATLIEPTSGEAYLEGVSLREPSAARSKVGYVAGERPGLFGRLTVRENLEFFAALYGLYGPSLRIEELSARFGLDPHLDRKMNHCSSGIRQRFVLARALLPDPRVLLLDEPTKHLDPRFREEMVGSLRQLSREGRTTLLVTHDLQEAKSVCHRAGWMAAGKLTEVDPRGLGSGRLP
ncbi:MAG: ABC transporter ATP-binding protein [Acidobacteria bacterium]|nr:ABC transporter ATP-binding protein [Acidobacteriota bacterium]